MNQYPDSRAGSIQRRSTDTDTQSRQFPLLTRGKFAGLRISDRRIPIRFIKRIAANMDYPYMAVSAQCFIDGEPAPMRNDIRVIRLEADKEYKEVI